MLSTLTHKPFIGMASGLASGLLLTVQHFVTDEKSLRVVGAIGIWGGALVAGLTALLKLIELVEKFKRKKA